MNASLRASTFSTDNLGVWASALCVVHCVVTPVVISMSVVMARFIPGEERTHRTLAVGVAALGAMALVKGFRTHGRRRILGLMALGLAFIFAGAFFGGRLPSHGWEVAVTMTGSADDLRAPDESHVLQRLQTVFGPGCGSLLRPVEPRLMP
jgi:hypothetical protein